MVAASTKGEGRRLKLREGKVGCVKGEAGHHQTCGERDHEIVTV